MRGDTELGQRPLYEQIMKTDYDVEALVEKINSSTMHNAHMRLDRKMKSHKVQRNYPELVEATLVRNSM